MKLHMDFLSKKDIPSLLKKRRNSSSAKWTDLPKIMSREEFEEEAKVSKYLVHGSIYHTI